MSWRSFERWMKRQLARVLVELVRPRPALQKDVADAHVARLVIIRQHNQMGDMVLALPALQALRRAFPKAHLTFVAGPLSDQLLRDHPDVDELIVYRSTQMFRPWRLWSLVRRLRRERPGLAIVLGTVSFSFTSALLAWATGAPLRVGLSSRPFGTEMSRALYNFEVMPSDERLHEVEHNLKFVRALGLDAPTDVPRLVPTAAARRLATDFVMQRLPARDGPLVALHVGAGKTSNLWPVERFARVAQQLMQQLAARVVVTEGPRDAGVVSKFRHLVPEAARWQSDLGQTLAILERADLYIGNDTGMSHVAAATGVPCVVIFGPHDARRWSPAGTSVRTLSAQSGNIEDVQPEEVLAAAVLAHENARHAH